VLVYDLGASVHGEGENAEPAEETVAALPEAGGDGMAHFGDIASPDYTEELIEDAVAEYRRVDVSGSPGRPPGNSRGSTSGSRRTCQPPTHA